MAQRKLIKAVRQKLIAGLPDIPEHTQMGAEFNIDTFYEVANVASFFIKEETEMARCTNVTYLMHKKSAASTFEKIIDITEYPDMGGATNKLDATTLSDKKKRTIDGVEETADLEFKAWYDKADYKKLYDIEKSGTIDGYQLWFGEDGEDGIWEWSGKMHVFANGGTSDNVSEMTFSITDEGDEELRPVFDKAGV